MTELHFDRERDLARAARDIRPGVDLLVATPSDEEAIAAVLHLALPALKEMADYEGITLHQLTVAANNLPFLLLQCALGSTAPRPDDPDSAGRAHIAALQVVELSVPSMARDRVRRLREGKPV